VAERVGFSAGVVMFWLLLTVLTILGFFALAARRRRYESVEDEPWRASLQEDEPLDWDAARRAENEWLAENEWQEGEGDNEPWRGQ
jgi:hypothetical protein